MVEYKQDAQIVMVHQYVNQKNHIMQDVGREAIENISFFAHIALPIFFQMTLRPQALERKIKN